jgi:hypothetical protein
MKFLIMQFSPTSCLFIPLVQIFSSTPCVEHLINEISPKGESYMGLNLMKNVAARNLLEEHEEI